jgi:glucose/mannose-6-phosphate isomerase
MIDDVLAIPDHLRDALWRIESVRLEAAPSAGLFVCGMGGSAIGGDLAAAALADGDRPRIRAAELGDPRVDRALLELLG